MKKNLLGLEIADICSDCTTVYKCDAVLENAFEQVAFYAGFSIGTSKKLSKRKADFILEALFPYLRRLNLVPCERPKAINQEVHSRWVRTMPHSNGSPQSRMYAAVVDVYLSRELLRLRVLLGGANKGCIEWGKQVSRSLEDFFSVYAPKDASVVYDEKREIATVCPAHSLSLVLAKAKEFYTQ